MLSIKKLFKAILFLYMPLSIQANLYHDAKNLLSTNDGAKVFLTQNTSNDDFFCTENFYPENISAQQFYPIIKQKLHQLARLEETNPICLLIECGADHCKLTRTQDGEYTRYVLENRILENIKTQFPNKNQNIVITDLGSGGLLQNLIIITKLLNEGYTNLTINLIDKVYKDNCFCEKNPAYLQTLKSNGSFKKIHLAVFNNHMFKQYNSYLKHNFPNAQIKINFFENMSAYIEESEKHLEIKTNVFLSIDTIIGDSAEKIIESLFYFYLSDALKVNGLVFLCFDAENIDSEEIKSDAEQKRNVITILKKESESPEEIDYPELFEYLPILMHFPTKPDYLSNYKVLENYIFQK